MSTEHDIKVFKSLIETVVDSADGYTGAAKAASGSRFADVPLQRGAERQELTTRLQTMVCELGGTPEDDGTLLAGASSWSLRTAQTHQSSLASAALSRSIATEAERALFAIGRAEQGLTEASDETTRSLGPGLFNVVDGFSAMILYSDLPRLV